MLCWVTPNSDAESVVIVILTTRIVGEENTTLLNDVRGYMGRGSRGTTMGLSTIFLNTNGVPFSEVNGF